VLPAFFSEQLIENRATPRAKARNPNNGSL
jgi:hypothetical protein